MRILKILLLSQFFSTTKGGGEYVFSLMSRSLANDGNGVWVITNEIEGEKYPIHENIKIIKVPPRLKYQGGLPPGFNDNLRYTLNSIRKGYSLIKKEKIDIIHSNNFAPALAGSILSSLTGVPHITTIHDIFSLCGKDYWKRWGRQTNISRLNVILAPFFEKMMIKLNHEAIHTVSEASKNDLIRFGAKNKIYIIPNSIEFKEFKDQTTKPFQFIFIGRLVFYKNLEVVIKAISIIKDSYPQIKLIIVGDGPYRKNLESFVSKLGLNDYIDFKGFLSSDDKTMFLASSQALVFPSLCEGFGLVILEAFEQRKPVIVSDIPPLSDIVVHKKTGLVISPHDEHEWAKAMISIIDDSAKSQNMGISGRELLEKQYNSENMKEKILKMYSDCVK